MLQNRGRRLVGQRTLGVPIGRLPGRALALAVVCWCLAQPFPGRAQEMGPSILESADTPLHYVLTLAGTVGQETFSGVKAVLTLSNGLAGSNKAYALLVVGFPTTASRNTFFWTSADGPMESLGGTIRSRFTGRGPSPARSHFFYLSPKLLAGIPLTQNTAEDRKRVAERIAKPTRIPALSGELTLNATKAAVTGRVVMNGLDPVSNEYVRYAATFTGRRGTGTTPAMP